MNAILAGADADIHDPVWHDTDDMRWAARHWAARIGVKTPNIQIRQMRTKWASISTAGRLTLNTDLLTLPKSLGEFVIVHELVHLLAPNHGKVFKVFMHAYLPDWQAREKHLRAIERDALRAQAKRSHRQSMPNPTLRDRSARRTSLARP